MTFSIMFLLCFLWKVVQCLVWEDLLFLIVTICASKMIRGMNPDHPYSFFPLHGDCTFRLLSSQPVAVAPEAEAHGVQLLMDWNQGYKSHNLCLRPAPWLLVEQHDSTVGWELENRCWQEVVLIMKHGEWCNNSLGD